MVWVFGVPIHGSLLLLFALACLFVVCSLGLGLLVSTIARTQLAAMQIAFLIMLPSVLLSGFMFPRDAMPLPIQALTYVCLLYTSDAADERSSVDLGGRRIIKKKK